MAERRSGTVVEVLKRVLEELTVAFPPEGKARHNFMVAEGALTLTVYVEARWYSFVLDAEDGDLGTLVEDVKRLMSSALIRDGSRPVEDVVRRGIDQRR